MTRKFKTLGVALFAVLAMAAVSTSAASAANYTASSYPTTGTATSNSANQSFAFEAGFVSCAAHFQGTLKASSWNLTVIPVYTGCSAFGFLNATVNMNGCSYSFRSPAGSGDEYSAFVDIVCPAGKVIEITAATCKLTIGNQFSAGAVYFVNDTAAQDTTFDIHLIGIAYTVVADGFGCPFAGTGAKTGASYSQGFPVTFDSTNGASIHVG
jgi:hypothetical protein